MLYRMIVSQLRYDGYETAASSLAHTISSFPPTSPSSRLSHLVHLGLQTEGEAASNPELLDMLPHVRGQGVLDLEYESDEPMLAPPCSQHEVTYTTAHKGPCLTAAFSHDGKLAASASADSSIKVLDVDMMKSKASAIHDMHPVLRSLYDHTDAVTMVNFHPTISLLASGSKDCTVKLFDYSKPSAKRSYRTLREVAPIRCLSFHPSGEYMIIGTEHSTLRLYDVNTLQCFVSSDARDQHSAAITALDYAQDGRLYTTASKDGSIKIWDGVSNRCVSTFKEAHSHQPVSSVKFSKNSKYVLSSGKDGNAILWELSTARPLNTYQPSNAKLLPYRPCAVFNHTEDYIFMPEDKIQQVVLSWNSRTSQPLAPLVSGHLATIRCLAHSPNSPAFITGGNDCKVRFFFYKLR